ncbi:hypothetical protein MUN78_12560 [Leucobacter allii]|uniref:Uncharacterized protein n=1 Tax=Leucobacter allii TaxID=2932247 RepID=A0ABY4FK16_9MICO|nr:hypothetical protein [Leucobacter allii]UOQ56504.1 hypothetical protein MUN78_12560 [Leucobacter allii]UOR00937.1 hypothetical protein MUN77_12385 [Leucobacter allii]
MSTPDAASGTPRQDPADTPVDPAEPVAPERRAAAEPDRPAAEPAPAAAAAPEEASQDAPREPIVETVEREVVLQRSVRYGRVLIGGAVLGGVLAALACLFFPIDEDAEYTMAQAMGLMLLVGGAIGLCLGGVLALVLGRVAKRRSGGGVAIQADVR